MENSILTCISGFVKVNNIWLHKIQFKINDLFPEEFYNIIVENLKIANTNYQDNPKLESFYINFDSNNNPYFEFLGNDNKTRVIILNENVIYSNLPSARIIKENYLIERSKHNDMVKNSLILNSIPEKFRKRFLSNINISESFNKILYNFGNHIISYIEYLQKLKEESIEKIYFTEADAAGNLRSSSSSPTRPTSDRKYDEIPFKEREKILNSYSPEEQFEAKARNTDSVYLVKVYKIKSKAKYKLVLEPKEGTKYTKIVHIDADNLTKPEIRQLVIDSLQLNREDISNRDDVTRHCHTTSEEFKKLLEYLVNDANLGISASAKYNIDNANKKR